MINGQRDGGCSRRTITGNPPLRRTAFWAISASVWREVMWRSAQIYFREKLNHKSKTNSIPEPILVNRESQSSGSKCFKLDFITILTAGSVISSRSPAWMTVRTRASIPPTWQTTVLLRWLLHVKLERIPAAQVTTLTSLEPSSCTRAWRRPSRPSCCCGMSKGTKQAKKHPAVRGIAFFLNSVSKPIRSSNAGKFACRKRARPTTKVPTNLFRSGIRQITAGPQTVLDQTMALMTQMHCQGLHSTSFDDGRLVAWADRQNYQIQI